MNTQIIEMNGAPAFAVVPLAEWNALLAQLENLQDIADIKSALKMETFPAAFADRLLSGEAPLKA